MKDLEPARSKPLKLGFDIIDFEGVFFNNDMTKQYDPKCGHWQLPKMQFMTFIHVVIRASEDAVKRNNCKLWSHPHHLAAFVLLWK